MKIICCSQDESHRVTFSLNIWLHLVIPALLVATLMGILVSTQSMFKSRLVQVVQKTTTVEESKAPVSADDTHDVQINLLARRLGMLEAESLRLNAFGARIVKMARLDPEEFAFDESPSVGGARGVDENGAVDNDAGYGISVEALMQTINDLEKQLMDQRNRLEGVLQVINGRILDKEVMPDGMPVEKGYISSRFGFRRDPFTGKKRMHKGIDFASRKGTPVSSVAGGVVQYAGNRGGYGNVVEIDHGDGIVTRYGHLSVIEAKVGQVVKKGDRIALVGSTGRSTGPHLHLEVIKNGVQQNPARYLARLSGHKKM